MAIFEFTGEPAWDALCAWLERSSSSDIGPEARQYAADAVVLLECPYYEDELSKALAEAFEAGRFYQREAGAVTSQRKGGDVMASETATETKSLEPCECRDGCQCEAGAGPAAWMVTRGSRKLRVCTRCTLPGDAQRSLLASAEHIDQLEVYDLRGAFLVAAELAESATPTKDPR